MFNESRLLFQNIDVPRPSDAEGDSPVNEDFDVEEYGQKRREKFQRLHEIEEASREDEGFAELSEVPEILERYTAEEKLAILQSLLEEAPELPEKVQLRLQQVEILRLVVENAINEIRSPKTTLQKWAEMGNGLRSMLRLPTPAKDMLKRKADDMEQMLERDIPVIVKEVLKGEKTLEEVLEEFPRLQRVSQEAYKGLGGTEYVRGERMRGHAMQLYDPETQEDVLSQYNLLMRYYRYRQNYEGAEALAYQFIGEDLEQQVTARKKLILRKEAHDKITKLADKHRKAWAQHMTQEQTNAYIEALVEQDFRHRVLKEGAVIAKKTFHVPGNGNGSEYSLAKMQMYNQYVDMRDPHGHWFNVKDENWDTIVEELCVNAPLIIASGGVAGVVSTGARTVALRMLPTLAVKQGAKWTASNMAKRAAVGVPVLLVEGATFEMMHSGLQGEWLFSKDWPEWGSRILWSSATLGMIHGGARVGERAFTRQVGQEMQSTMLGNYVNNISNAAVRECAKQCLVKGHTEVAAMLIAGAAQHGAYNGNLDEFFENFGDEVLHAYVTVGALKVGRASIETTTGKVFQPRKSLESITGEQLRSLAVEARKNPAVLKEQLKRSDIDDASRSELAAILLGKDKLTPAQEAALIDAHNKPGVIDSLTEGQKTVKGLALMRNEAFTRQEAQLLMDAGLAGAPSVRPYKVGDIENIGLKTLRIVSVRREGVLFEDAKTGEQQYRTWDVLPHTRNPFLQSTTAEAVQTSQSQNDSQTQQAPRQSPPPPLPPVSKARTEQATDAPKRILPKPPPPPPPRRRGNEAPKPASRNVAGEKPVNAELQMSIDAALMIANTPNAKLPPPLTEALQVTQGDTPIYVHTHMNNSQSPVSKNMGYRSVMTQEGEFCNRRNSDYWTAASSRDLHRFMQRYNLRSTSETKISESGNSESIRLSGEREGKRVLVYRYEAEAYKDTTPSGRRGTMLAIGIELPTAKANEMYRILQQNPEAARAFFITAGQNVPEANYIWSERAPSYSRSDAERKLIFVDEASHLTQGLQGAGNEVLHIDYLVKEQGQWRKIDLKQDAATSQEFQRLNAEAMEKVQRERRIDQLARRIDGQLRIKGLSLQGLEQSVRISRDARSLDAILKALDVPDGFWKKGKQKKILKEQFRDEVVAIIVQYINR